MSRCIVAGAIAPLLLLSSTTAYADVTFGGSKAAGMGGAGLALGNDPFGPGARNPAWLALNPRSYFSWPSLRYDLEGIRFGDLDKVFRTSGSGSGVLDTEGLGRIARTFGDRNVEAGASFAIGGQFNRFALDIRAEGSVLTNPNGSLQNWVRAGSDLTAVPADAFLDGYGLGVIDFGLSLGHELKAPEGKFAIGGRFKIVQSFYSHYVVDNNAIVAGGSAQAPEMNGKSLLRKTGVGIDAGVHYASTKHPGWSGALLVNNLIEPNIRFDARRPVLGGTERIRPVVRTVDLGLAFDKGPWLAAVDLIDAFNSGSRRDLRLGGEVHAGRWLAVRAGWGSLSGPTVGVGVAGFNLAFSRRFPIDASFALRF